MNIIYLILWNLLLLCPPRTLHCVEQDRCASCSPGQSHDSEAYVALIAPTVWSTKSIKGASHNVDIPYGKSMNTTHLILDLMFTITMNIMYFILDLGWSEIFCCHIHWRHSTVQSRTDVQVAHPGRAMTQRPIALIAPTVWSTKSIKGASHSVEVPHGENTKRPQPQ